MVTSNNSSMPEVAGAAGLLVDPLAPNSIAEALLRIAQHQPLRKTLADAAGAQASRFCWDRAAEATLAVLFDAAAAKRCTSPLN